MPIDEPLRRLFESAVDEYADSMYRVAYRLTGCRDAAGELVQETYMQAWRNLTTLSDRSKIRGWMFAILRNQFSKQRQRSQRYRPLTEPLASELVRADRQTPTDQQEMVQSAISQLDDDHKLPVLLVSMEQMSVDSAAEVLGIPRGTVLSRLHRARQKLKDILERQILADPC